jgi:hypothetical protein
MSRFKQWLRCKLLGHTPWPKKGYNLCLDCGDKLPSKPKEDTIADIRDLMKKEQKDEV